MAMSASPPPGSAAFTLSGSRVHDDPRLVERHTSAGGVGKPAMAEMYIVPSGATSMPGSLSSALLTTTGVRNVVAAPAPVVPTVSPANRPTTRPTARSERPAYRMRATSPSERAGPSVFLAPKRGHNPQFRAKN